MKNIEDLTFGLSVVTAYGNGKISATFKHDLDNSTRCRISYDHSLSRDENHYEACKKVLYKVLAEDGEHFAIIAYTYSEKGNGYNFICQRQS